MTDQQAFIVVGLGFGDEGKGSITDFITRQRAAELVVRYNGGSQAAHNVMTADGRHHTFSQFGSGSLVAGTKTHLSRFMLVNPINLLTEANALIRLGETDILSRLTVDSQALLTTPLHIAMNRLREIARGEGRHGSCGLGIGETRFDYLEHGSMVPVMGDLQDLDTLRDKLRWLHGLKEAQAWELAKQSTANLVESEWWWQLRHPEMVDRCMAAYRGAARLLTIVDGDYLPQLLRATSRLVMEGAQGVLLDERRGFHPYTTWSNIRPDNALTLLEEAGFAGQVQTLGLLRSYASRHGAGPLVTEQADWSACLVDEHNEANPWQDGFRVGSFDLVMARYALEACGGVDSLAISHLDKLADLPDQRWCSGYWTDRLDLAEDLADIDDRGRIVRLRPSPTLDVAYQSRLTELVMSCRPDYEQAPSIIDKERFIAQVTESLGKPVHIASYGPTAEDKQWLE